MRLPNDLQKLLERDGWSVTRRTADLDWWAHEVWTLESRWSPHGLTLYLTFLTDPQPGNLNPFASIGTSLTFPSNRSEASGEPTLAVTPHWVDDLPAFVGRLSALRQSGTSEAGRRE